MKKYLMSLAALMITLSATVLTSCNPKNEPENVVTPGEITPEPGTHVETLTIAFPEQTQTRVAIDGSYNLTGWELGDEVTLVRTYYEVTYGEFGPEGYIFNVEDTYTFTCTNAANGTFTGTMPDSWTVEDCQLAFYNATGFATDGTSSFYFSPKSRASQNMKDVVMLVAKNDGEGNFEMEIFGSILQVTNNTGADITASVKYSWFGDGWYYDYNQIFYDGTDFYDFETNIIADVNHPITLSKDAPTYVFIPVYNLNGGDEDFAVGLSAAGDAANECSIVPFKTNPGNAKLFKKTLTPATTGTAAVTVTDNVNANARTSCGWVQLWENGPKWAEFNVGASATTYANMTEYSFENIGGYYSFTGNQHNSYNSGVETATSLWGSNWRTPSYDEENAMLNNCDFTYCDGTTVQYESGCTLKGYKVSGRGAYASNHIFLPLGGVDDQNRGPSYVVAVDSRGLFWSTLSGGYGAYFLHVKSDGTKEMTSHNQPHGCSVRAVLAE